MVGFGTVLRRRHTNADSHANSDSYANSQSYTIADAFRWWHL